MAEARNMLAAVGIGVSDLDRSVDFYTRVLGMTKLRTYDLDHMVEVIVGYDGAVPLALMKFKGGAAPACADLPVKLVFSVEDPVGVAARIRAEGLEITREPTPLPEFGDMIVGLAKDPDGYVVELLQA